MLRQDLASKVHKHDFEMLNVNIQNIRAESD